MHHKILRTQHLHYLRKLDQLCKDAALKLRDGGQISDLLLHYIRSLYFAAKAESDFADDDPMFETAYHTPVTGDVEFMFARILYYYSSLKDIGWKILLRRQVGKFVPDIRIEIDDQTLAVIEIKTKVGWIQPFFSEERVAHANARKQAGESNYDPQDTIMNIRSQLWKYINHFSIPDSMFFMLIPSLKQAHRKKSDLDYSSYRNTFTQHSGLSSESLVVLTHDLNYEASGLEPPQTVSDDFEGMLSRIASLSS